MQWMVRTLVHIIKESVVRVYEIPRDTCMHLSTVFIFSHRHKGHWLGVIMVSGTLSQWWPWPLWPYIYTSGGWMFADGYEWMYYRSHQACMSLFLRLKEDRKKGLQWRSESNLEQPTLLMSSAIKCLYKICYQQSHSKVLISWQWHQMSPNRVSKHIWVVPEGKKIKTCSHWEHDSVHK